ncbi:hypothetical protein BST55_14670 [Vibrio vulnificus]|nr:hypothetical protein BST51_13920 [Vibrio vulnificus]OZS57237.1 hypothetical protein BST52_13850 [Vibrio vulnificus]OZS61610.1 hypothetical protein BST56_15265 [Vibrio vulnificus]PAO27071.1 hypothetical protein BTT96_12300 [Vibrio vulnificus]PAO33909.1 hypothetical protein BTT97_16625 [Vibrio vulnificus]
MFFIRFILSVLTLWIGTKTKRKRFLFILKKSEKTVQEDRALSLNDGKKVDKPIACNVLSR